MLRHTGTVASVLTVDGGCGGDGGAEVARKGRPKTWNGLKFGAHFGASTQIASLACLGLAPVPLKPQAVSRT